MTLKLHPLRFQIIELKGRTVMVRYLEDNKECEEERSIKTTEIKVLPNKLPKKLKPKKKRAHQRALRYEVIREFRYKEIT